eukprot:3387114-Pyramimonas_sp.AAC.1
MPPAADRRELKWYLFGFERVLCGLEGALGVFIWPRRCSGARSRTSFLSVAFAAFAARAGRGCVAFITIAILHSNHQHHRASSLPRRRPRRR